MEHKYCCILVVVCLFSPLAGCIQPHEPSPPPNTGLTIPLKVWVVVGLGESVGNQDNRGSRLAVHEIQTIVARLQENAFIFAPDMSFQWVPAVPTEVVDNAVLPFAPNRGTRTREQFLLSVVLNFWQQGHINIYYVGNVQSQPSGVALASTLDPAGAPLANPPLPCIIMNDGGFLLGHGFLAGQNPADYTSHHVLEHEMTHYLARFDNRTFGQPPHQRIYDSNEHVPFPSNNILQEAVGQGDPLVVPGIWDQLGTENNEIWNRISSGNWNNP